jgi:hypothetical protein
MLDILCVLCALLRLFRLFPFVLFVPFCGYFSSLSRKSLKSVGHQRMSGSSSLPGILTVYLQRAHMWSWFPRSLLCLVLRFGQRYAISLSKQDAIIQPSRSPYGNIPGSRKELG